eukprot:CAMPEP_0117676928 /NCGR_PEP_ID=MMETSP0804-20121206/16473_1 /TAXON_ID=1074897 /ORGANISM="Tetraselmis astigmatica, Strain CCMP880" /LENGTH=620 /DNA_ID=CAMNT_0005486177 /DNA_START=236 /DNA_END=2098 /DNA_ORIENTATION=-
MLVDIAAGYAECNGMGRRFCETAHKADLQCPFPCQLENCAGVVPTELARRGAERPGGKPTWEELAFSGLYEFVYTDGKYLCLSSCWEKPWKAECKKWHSYWGTKYCQKLSCKHDERDRYSGCHADPATGDRKKPWHRPTCKECARVFPTACSADLKEYLDAERAKELEEKRLKEARALEMEGRKYCYRTYFGSLEEDSDSDSSSSSRRALKDSSSSESGSTNNRDKGTDDDKDELQDKLQRLKRKGHLACPPAQCLTSNISLLHSYYQEKLYWYHTTQAGQCIRGGCGEEGSQAAPSDWCQSRAKNCVECGLTWCPPADGQPNWGPVTRDTFKAPSEVQWDNANPAAGMLSIIDFNRDACEQTTVTGMPLEEAEGLEWMEPTKTSDANMAAEAATELGQEEEAEEFKSWMDDYSGPTLDSVYLVFQITEQESEVNMASMLTAVAHLSDEPISHVGIVEEDIPAGVGAAQTTVSLAIVSKYPEELAELLLNKPQSAIEYTLDEEANVTYLLWSLSAVSKPVPATIFPESVQEWWSTRAVPSYLVYIGVGAAACLAACATLAAVLLVLRARHKAKSSSSKAAATTTGGSKNFKAGLPGLDKAAALIPATPAVQTTSEEDRRI